MAIIRSFGTIQSATANSPTWQQSSQAGGSWYPGLASSYAQIYRTQPAVRTVVDFLARNMAQLSAHSYRRVSDTDRVRLANHDVTRWLKRPNPGMTRYRLFEALMQDLGIYLNAFWLKVRGRELGLVRLPPDQMTVVGSLYPTGFIWTPGHGEPRTFAPSEIVYFGGYDPSNPLTGLAPIETLRRILAEEVAAQSYRAHYFKNAARVDGFIQRPKEAGRWDETQMKEWKRQWRNYQGAAGAGDTPVLQDGMTFVAATHSAKDSELTASRKLTREEVAAAYHVPLPMVGILDRATFSNVKEQHKHLYQDCLGPWCVMIEEELERQVLIESRDTEGVYIEFNIQEKLKGSFEEQAASIQALVGGPIMTVNEGRGRVNLPSSKNPKDDEVARPLNMSSGSRPGAPAEADADADDEEPLDTAEAARVIQAHWHRQQARLAKVPPPQRVAAFNLTRWNHELTTDLTPVLGDAIAGAVAQAINRETLAFLDQQQDPFSRPLMLPVLPAA